MSNVEFDTDQSSRPSPYSGGQGYSYQQNPENTGIRGWLIRKGLAKDGHTAVVICAVIVIVNIAIIYWSWEHAHTAPSVESGVPAQDIHPGHYVNSYHPVQ